MDHSLMAYLRRLLRDTCGTASVEAAVMLPLMAICWGGLFWRFQGLEKQLDAAAEARRDAWVYSAAGCEGTPPEGTGIACGGKEGDAIAGDWMNVVSKIPLLGFLVDDILGVELTKYAKREQDRPKMFGGGKTGLMYPYTLMCNEKSRSTDEILTGVICEQVSSMGLSLDFAVDCPKRPERGGKNCNP